MAKLATDRVLGDIGRRVQELRRARGLTQEGFAEIAGWSAIYQWQIESGQQNLTIASLVTIANLLKTDLKALLDKPATRVRRPGRPRTR